MAKQKPLNKNLLFLEQMGLQNVDFIKTGFDNTLNYQDFLMQFANDVMSIFKWSGLPNTCDERFLEFQLWLNGYCIFFKDRDNDQFFNLGGALSDPDIYGNLQTREPIAQNGAPFGKYSDLDSVIIYNNSTRTASTLTAQNYAYRLYNIVKTIDVNLNTMKKPFLIATDKYNEKALKNFMLKYDGNQNVVYFDSNQSLRDAVQVLDLQADPHLQDLMQLYNHTMDNAMINQGIPIGSEKKERLISSEGTASNAQNMLISLDKLKIRQLACEQINRLFGLNVWCEFTETYQMLINSIVGVDGLNSINSFVDETNVGDTETIIREDSDE